MAAPDDPIAPAPSPAEVPPAPDPEAAGTQTGIQTEAEADAPPPPPALSPEEWFALWRKRLDAALVAVVLLLAFEVGFFPIRNPDLLMNRAVGRLVAHGQYDFYSDPFTWTTEGVRWVNHSWLFGLFVYGMHQLGDALGNPELGDTLLIVLKGLLLAALAEIMMRLGSQPGRRLWLPALCTGLAVLALSNRVYLQPVCVSYLFLGLTVYLLEAPRRRQAAAGPAAAVPFWNVRWLIPAVCALWVNLDGWFLLGPAVIALYLLGQVLDGSVEAKKSVPNLAAVLAASVAACLLNPYHVHAFRLPDQLGFSPAARELQNDLYLHYFVSPLQNTYFANGVNRSLAGLAYYPLVFLGLASFANAPRAAMSWRGTVWGGLLLLSVVQSRAIPFFAVVAGPITALNLLAAGAGSYVDVPADPDRRRRLLSVRVLTLLLGIAAFTAGSAGWLHVPVWGPEGVTESHRPGWWTEFDNSLVKAADQINEWRQAKRVPDDARWFNTQQDTSSYLAWYAPGARVCIDSRLSLFSADVARQYRDARTALGQTPEQRAARGESAAEADPAWAAVFQGRPGYVVVAESDLARRVPTLLPALMADATDWTLCFLYGNAGVFGWNGAPGGAAAYAPIRYDAARLAFGPGAELAPLKRPVTATEPPQWWEIIWQPEPRRSADVADVVMHLSAFENQAKRRFATEARDAALQWILSAGTPPGPVANGTLTDLALFGSGLLRDPGPPGDLYLAVRSARRAVANNPEDGRAWYLLGVTYNQLESQTRERLIAVGFEPIREFRRIQKIVALTRAVRWNPEIEQAHVLLAETYQQSGFLDLVLRHREAQFKAVQKAKGESAMQSDAGQDQLKTFQDELSRLQGERKARADQYELESGAKPPFQRAQLALRYGLAEEALKAVRDHIRQLNDGSVDERSKAPGLALAVRLMIITGEIDEARLLVQEGGQALAAMQDRSLPVLPEAAADWYRILIDAAAGDYADADETLKDLIGRTSVVPLGREMVPVHPSALVAAGLGDQLLLSAAQAGNVNAVLGRFFQMIKQGNLPPDGVLTLQQSLQSGYARLGRAADLQTLRGWLALESGEVETARDQLTDVTTRAARPYSMMIAARALGLADMLMGWLRATDKK